MTINRFGPCGTGELDDGEREKEENTGVRSEKGYRERPGPCEPGGVREKDRPVGEGEGELTRSGEEIEVRREDAAAGRRPAGSSMRNIRARGIERRKRG